MRRGLVREILSYKTRQITSRWNGKIPQCLCKGPGSAFLVMLNCSFLRGGVSLSSVGLVIPWKVWFSLKRSESGLMGLIKLFHKLVGGYVLQRIIGLSGLKGHICTETSTHISHGMPLAWCHHHISRVGAHEQEQVGMGMFGSIHPQTHQGCNMYVPKLCQRVRESFSSSTFSSL